MYNPGYWKASPAAFKRDAEVYAPSPTHPQRVACDM